jgi:4-hydroxy-tetrahydrodipicolinate synthase
VLKRIRDYENTGIAGILSVCPYYNRPSHKGQFLHFKKISESTDLDIIIYNIPYRTGVNMSNDTLLKLSEFDNIVGVKDSCGDIRQSLDLIGCKPEDFAVFTGEDHLFYTTVINGGDGGILASAHLYTDEYTKICNYLKINDYQKALGTWKKIRDFIPKLFEEPNPGPIKYCLSALKLIRSAETRAPLVGISTRLQKQLDMYLEKDKRNIIGS